MVTVLHPGEIGATLTGELQAAGHRVGCLLAGRSARTVHRAGQLGMTEFTSPREAAEASEAIVLACPPAAMPAVVRSLGRFDGPVVAVAPMAPSSAPASEAAVREVGGTYVGGALNVCDGELLLSGPGAAAAEALWRGSRLRTRPMPDLAPTAAPVLALLRLAWAAELTASAARVTRAARAAELIDQLDELAPAPTAPACRHTDEEIRRMFAEAEAEPAGPVPSPTPSPTPRTPPERPGLLRSLLRRPPSDLTLDEQLRQWDITLEPDEAVSWFGACATEAGHCFLVLTQHRVWRVRSDGTAVDLPHSLSEVTTLALERQRLTVTASGWSLEVRGLAAGRDLTDLHAAFVNATGVRA